MDVSAIDLRLPDADALLVVPPLAHLTWPALGVHQLQASARAAGFEVAVLYANVLYGAVVGPFDYADLANAPTSWLLGERLFARAAYGSPPLGFRTRKFRGDLKGWGASVQDNRQRYLDHLSDATGEAWATAEPAYHLATIEAQEAAALALAERLGEAIGDKGYGVVGATTTFDQTAGSLAILDRVKRRSPGTTTILGGANCEAAMGGGIRSLAAAVDHVFSGESEATFVQFLGDRRAGRPTPPIVHGTPCADLDALPTPRFDEYFEQVARHLPEIGTTPLWVSYETSRGCWWGQKHHCTFCGLNGLGLGFREKSADRVVEQLREILEASPTRRVCMTDNIMPHRYHTTLVPRLPAEVPDLHVFYEQKANLGLSQVKALWDGGSKTIQPGIEALDSALLALMRKGVKARQNVALLRYARSVGMAVKWNLLWGFPGDDEAMYRRTLALVPKLRHLCPPNALAHLAIDRFSPYFDEAAAFGVTHLAPLEAYGDVFPPHADLFALAYHFDARYESGSDKAQELMATLNREVWQWRSGWDGDPRRRPVLHVQRTGPGRYALIDTRGLGTAPSLLLDDAQAEAVLVGGPRERTPRADWAVRNGYAADLDGWCVPLATAHDALLAEMEDRHRDVAAEAVRLHA